MAKEYSIIVRTIGLLKDPADMSTDDLGAGLTKEADQALQEIIATATMMERQPWELVSHNIQIVARHLIVSVLIRRQLSGSKEGR